MYIICKITQHKIIEIIKTPIISFRLLILSGLIVISFPVQVNSQKSSISFQHFNVEQGMSHENIADIYQDRTGYLWFITNQGLDRYDGYNFTSYKYLKKAKDIGNSFPKTISEDKEGNIWIASRNGGVEKFDPEKKTFKNYLPNPNQPESDWCNTVMGICIDKNEVMWVGTGNGFYKFNKSSETFTSFKHDENDPSSLGHNSVNAVYEDRSGTLWLATGGGLDRFDRETNKFFHYWHYPNNVWGDLKTKEYSVLSITEDDEGILWLGTDGGLVEFDRKAETFVSYIPEPQNPSSVFNNSAVLSLCEDASGLLWIGTPRGLGVFNKRSKIFSYYVHDEKDPGSISSNIVTTVLLDQTGSIWIGTLYAGVNKLDSPNPLFKKYVINSLNKASLSSEEVLDLYEDNNGTIWVGTNKGLKIFDLKNETIISKYNFNNNRIIHDKSENILVIPGTGGLYKLNNFNQWTCYIDSTTATEPELIRSFYHGSNDRYWLGNVRGDLNSLYPFTKKIKWITNIKKTIRTIYEDSYGLVWFGGYSTGLFCYDPIKNSVSEYNSVPDDSSTLIDNSFFSFFEDKNKTLWLGCGTGLVRFNRAKNNFTRFYGNDGFLNTEVRQILEDEHGNLWMSTEKGITKFNPLSGQFKDYYAASYFPEIKLWRQVGCKTENGGMYFGGYNGFIWFHPDSIIDDSFIPPIVITNFRKFEKPFPFGKEVELPHTDNFISFEFAALSYINSAENQYAYRMEGIDKDWIYCGTRRYASYPNMGPGEYIFRVKGSTSNRVWNEAGTSIKIIIFPPWWKTWWAYLLYTLVVLSIFITSTRFYLNRQRLKHKLELESEHSEKLEEIAKMKSDFFANISHEFRTPLTLIFGPAKDIIDKSNDTEIKQSAVLIKRNAGRLYELVNQLLDLSKLDAGKMTLETRGQNIIPLLKGLVLSFTSLAERKKITLMFNTMEESLNVYIDEDKVEKIITNLLSNTFKFTPEGGKIDFTVEKLIEDVEIRITDDGRGIPRERIDKIFDRFYQVDGSHTRESEGTGIGLALTKELVELHKGRIKVESKEGEGTTFTVLLPLGKGHLKQEEIVEKDVFEETEVTVEETEFIPETENRKEKTDIDALLDTDLSAGKAGKPLLLIVEDNPDVRKYIISHLEEDYRIQDAVDGEDGLQEALKHIPDLIVSDVMMPKMDGFELCEKLKTDERSSHIPIILLTAKATSQDKIEGYETGADDYIMKPFDAKELQARIKNLIDQRKKLREHFLQEGIFNLDNKNITSIDKKFLQNVIRVINKHLSDTSFNVEMFAGEVLMSRRNLDRKIIALAGESPSDIIKRIRLTRASKLLMQKFGNISEIALEVGFSNPAYFSKCFREQFGLNPSEYENNHSL